MVVVRVGTSRLRRFGHTLDSLELDDVAMVGATRWPNWRRDISVSDGLVLPGPDPLRQCDRAHGLWPGNGSHRDSVGLESVSLSA